MNSTSHNADPPSLPQRSGGKWLFRGVLAAFSLVLLLPLLSLAIYGWRVNQQRALLEEIDDERGCYLSKAPVEFDKEPWFVRWLGEEWAMPAADEIELTSQIAPDADDMLAKVCGVLRVYSLKLSGGPIDDSDLSSIARLKSLKSLDLTATDISDVGVVSLLLLPRLTDLDLSATEISDESLKTVAQLKTLSFVRLRNTPVSQAAVDKLRQSRPKLKVAYFPVATQQQVAVVREVFKRGGYVVAPDVNPTARLAIIGSLPESNWKGFQWSKLNAIPELDTVSVIKFPMTEEVLAPLANVGQLRSIRVEQSAISSSAMEMIGRCDQLTHLSLWVDSLPEGWSQQIRKLARLESLSVYNVPIGRDDVAAIAELSHLTSLTTTKCEFDRGALEAVKLPPCLKQLDISSGNLDDRDVRQIAQLPNLESLGLIGNRGITDQSIDVLLSMPKLRRAAVDVTGVSKAGEYRLEEALRERNDNR